MAATTGLILAKSSNQYVIGSACNDCVLFTGNVGQNMFFGTLNQSPTLALFPQAYNVSTKNLIVSSNISMSNSAGRLTLYNVGSNIGVNTSTPSTTLDVNGNVNISSDLTINSNVNIYGKLTVCNAEIVYNSEEVYSNLIVHDTATFYDTVNIYSNVTIKSNAYVLGQVSTQCIRITQGGNITASSFDVPTSSIANIYSSNSYIGINTMTPQYQLDVNGKIRASQTLILNSNLVFSNASGLASINALSSNIGINNNNPQYTLDINGSIKSSNIIVTGEIIPSSYQKSSPGYTLLPGSLIFQWGSNTFSMNTSTFQTGTISFPVAFSGNAYSITTTLNDPCVSYSSLTNQNQTAIGISTLSSTSFTWIAKSTSSFATSCWFYWQAIGPS